MIGIICGKRGRPLLLLFWILLLAHPGGASEPTKQEAAAVRWSELLLLMQQHPALDEAKQVIEVARGQWRQARQFSNPVVEATMGRGYNRSGRDNGFEWGVKVDLGLSELWQRWPGIQAAEEGMAAADYQARSLRLQLFAEVRTLFWMLLYDQNHVESLQESQAQVQKLTELIKLRVEKGEARPVDRLRIENEWQHVRIELTQAQEQLYSHRRQLRLWFPDLPGEFMIEPEDFAFRLPDREALLEGVAARHPAILATRSRTEQLKARAVEEENRRIPTIGVAGFFEQELDRQAVGGVVTLELPVWNWNAGGIDRARAELSLQQSREQSEIREIKTLALEAHQRCLIGQETVRVHRDEILPRALQTVQASERLFQIGEVGLMDVLDARRVLLQTRRDYQLAQLQLQMDITKLLALTGEIEHEPS